MRKMDKMAAGAVLLTVMHGCNEQHQHDSQPAGALP